MLPVDVPDGFDHIGELRAVLVKVSHIAHAVLDLAHDPLQVLQGLQPLLHAIQLSLHCIAQLGLNGGLQQYAPSLQ